MQQHTLKYGTPESSKNEEEHILHHQRAQSMLTAPLPLAVAHLMLS